VLELRGAPGWPGLLEFSSSGNQRLIEKTFFRPFKRLRLASIVVTKEYYGFDST
jgi:hypothetical protein